VYVRNRLKLASICSENGAKAQILLLDARCLQASRSSIHTKKKSESILQNTLVKPQFLEQACGFSQARPHHPDKQG